MNSNPHLPRSHRAVGEEITGVDDFVQLKPLILSHLQHSTTVGAGFIGTQDISRVQSLQKDHVCNLLITNVLHASAEGAWFIPALAAAGYWLCILSAVGRTGINPVPTVDVCNTLAVNRLSS